MAAAVLLWKASGEMSCARATIQGSGVTLAQVLPSNHLTPCLASRRIQKHILSRDGQAGCPNLAAPRFLTRGRGSSFVPCHVLGRRAGHGPRLYNIYNSTGRSGLLRLHDRPAEWNTSSTASRFSFRVFWTFSFQHGFWKGSSNVLCLTDRYGKQKAVQGLSKFWSVLECFVMALNNCLLLISSSGKNDTTSVYTSQQL